MDDLSHLHPHGLFLRREALQFGYDDRDLARLVAAGDLARVRHGTYVPAATWWAADPVDRHLLRAQGVALTHDHRVALSHTSGALAVDCAPGSPTSVACTSRGWPARPDAASTTWPTTATRGTPTTSSLWTSCS